MTAIMDNVTCSPDPVIMLNPTVTYNLEEKLITATVIISLNSVTGVPENLVPILAIPKSSDPWTVLWTIQYDPAVFQAASFQSASQGVQVEAMPAGVRLLMSGPVPSPDPASPDQWKITIENEATTKTLLSYKLFTKHTRGNQTTSMFHDPTIVVTLDPMT